MQKILLTGNYFNGQLKVLFIFFYTLIHAHKWKQLRLSDERDEIISNQTISIFRSC